MVSLPSAIAAHQAQLQAAAQMHGNQLGVSSLGLLGPLRPPMGSGSAKPSRQFVDERIPHPLRGFCSELRHVQWKPAAQR